MDMRMQEAMAMMHGGGFGDGTQCGGAACYLSSCQPMTNMFEGLSMPMPQEEPTMQMGMSQHPGGLTLVTQTITTTVVAPGPPPPGTGPACGQSSSAIGHDETYQGQPPQTHVAEEYDEPQAPTPSAEDEGRQDVGREGGRQSRGQWRGGHGGERSPQWRQSHGRQDRDEERWHTGGGGGSSSRSWGHRRRNRGSSGSGPGRWH